ncbi:MAG: SpoIIE family protein phosphatase [Bacteroidetes bacterium]|nr:SpoIIE family protein phosphatase [Bacteroidota bacterium]
MRFSKISILFLLVLLFRSFSMAQQDKVKFNHISIDQGLSQSSIYCILQDKTGFLWFGTLDGANKYDGYEFTVYRNDPDDDNTLSDNLVLCIAEDDKGILWFGTNKGLNRFDPRTETFRHYFFNPDDSTSISNDIIRCLFFDKSGILWIGTNKGLNRFNPSSGGAGAYFSDLNDPATLSNNVIRVIHPDRNGFLWIGTDSGLNRFDPEKKTFTRYYGSVHDEKKNIIRAVYEDLSGTLWVGSDGGGLNILDTETGKFTSFINDEDDPSSISNDRIRSIFEDKNGVLWIGTYVGLNRINRENNSFNSYVHDPDNPYSLSNNKVMSMYQDRFGTFWIGTFGGGVNKVNLYGSRFDLLQCEPNNPNSLNSNVVLAVCEDYEKYIWIGTDRGLNRVDRANNKYTHFASDKADNYSLSDNAVTALCQDSDSILWIGTAEGILNRYDRHSGRFEHFILPAKDKDRHIHYGITKIYADRENNLWIGTYSGLNRFVGATKTFHTYQNIPGDSNSLSSNNVWEIFEDSFKNLWIGTDGGGLNTMNRSDEIFTHYRHKMGDTNSLNNDRVRCILEDPVRNLWVGTSGGLNRYNSETGLFKGYTVRDGLPNDIIYGMIWNKGHIWISTNYGLSKFNPATGVFKNFDTEDGLQSNEFNQGACFVNRHDEMFFGGIEGLNIFNADYIRDNPFKPQIVFTEFRISNQVVRPGREASLHNSVTYTHEISLNHKQNTISFCFAALHYIAPEKNRCFYMMEGFDDDWISADNRRFVTYTNLSPGEYVFRVKGTNCDNIWNEEGASIRIIIEPPFWKTGWFTAVVIIFLLLFIIAVIILREKKLRRAKTELQRLVEKRTRELEDQKSELEEQRDIAEKQRDQIRKQKEEITGSIHYASSIQTSGLPVKEYIEHLFREYFIIRHSKEIFSNDFYWISRQKGKLIIAFGDCAHSHIPGSLLAMLCATSLDNIVYDRKIIEPGEILGQLSANIIKVMGSEKLSKSDITQLNICISCFDPDEDNMQIAGGINPVYLVSGGYLHEVKSDDPRYDEKRDKVMFNVKNILVQEDDSLYFCSSGFYNQRNKEGEIFSAERFTELLSSVTDLPMNEQKEIIEKEFAGWKGNIILINDVLVLGIRL